MNQSHLDPRNVPESVTSEATSAPELTMQKPLQNSPSTAGAQG